MNLTPCPLSEYGEGVGGFRGSGLSSTSSFPASRGAETQKPQQSCDYRDFDCAEGGT